MSNQSGGIGFFGLLAVLLIGLKLTNYIDWSWWYVLAPLWGPGVLLIVVLMVAGVALLVLKILTIITGRKRR